MSVQNIIHLLVGCVAGASILIAPGAVGEARAETTCEEIKKVYVPTCASSLPNYSRSPDSWFESIKTFHSQYAKIKALEAEANACMEKRELYSSWKESCERREKEVAQEWSDHVEWKSKDTIQFNTYLEHVEKRNKPEQALSFIDEELAELEKVKQINMGEGLQVDVTALDARIARIEARRVGFKEAYDERLAKVKCPKKGKKNKRHFKTVKAHFLKDPEFAKTVKSLRVTGKKSSRYDYGKRTTFETLPTTVCVRDDKPAEPKCYVWETSVQRSKVKGGKWTKWDTVLVGGRQEMLCKNLR